jgi:arylsulfatase A-like enzyme
MSRPNVLVLLTDQQRGDTLGPDAPCATPNLGRVADAGVRFDRCYSPNTVCSPSRASLMTGELPHTHGMTHVSHTVPSHQARFQAGLPTWSERLQDAGYETGYVGKWHVERESGPSGFGFEFDRHYGSDAFAEAFERYREERDLRDAFEFEGEVAGSGPDDEYRPADGSVDDRNLDLSYVLRDEGYEDQFVYGTHAGPVEARRDHYAYELGREFIRDAAGQEDPWCLVVSTFGPHDPFVVPPEYYERYDPDEVELPESFDDDLSDRPTVYERMQSVWEAMDRSRFRELTACYYAYCTYLDERVGDLVDALEETGQRSETVVVFTSDHGDQLGAHGLVLKGAPAFEESYRVPLVVSHPDGPDGAVCGELVQSLDLAPTLVDLADADGLDCYGRSVAPTVRGDATGTDREVAVAEYVGQRYYWTHRVLWRDGDKFVFNPSGVDELYDLEADPHETTNLAVDPDPESRCRLESMARRLFREVRETGDETLANTDYPTLRYAPVGPHSTE